MKKRRWTTDDIARLTAMARRYPTAEIAREMGRGVSATIMMAHAHRISLRLKPKRGGNQYDLRVESFLDRAHRVHTMR